ncbi:MAG: hypothetical protein E7257_09770 [Lachnospiraceae bacterium]|nr:hypothetical protein [Lachnospiraceae bacterium]
MKKLLLTVMMISALALTACGKAEETKKTEATSEMNVDAKEDLADLASGVVEQVDSEKEEAQQTNNAYVGEYLDYDNNEPNLFISANGDGTYKLEIGIFRLAVFEDSDAVLTEAGLEFTAEDGAGNPIKGVITLEGNEAVVTFTESTWSLITNGTAYRYHRPSTQ